MLAIACAGLMGTAHAGEVLDLQLATGDGFILIDEAEDVVEPGVKAVTNDLNNDDFTSGNGFSPQGVQNCLMASSPAVCDSPPGSGKRVKNNLTGMGAFDTVYNVRSSGGTTEYFNYGKVTNQTGARMTGFKIVLGTGTGEDFTRADLSSEAAQLTMDNLVALSERAQEYPGADGLTEGQNPLQRAFFPGGLFGSGGQEGEFGYFTPEGTDADRVGFFFVPDGTDTLEATELFSTFGYINFFGSGLLDRTQVPEALFQIDPEDPDGEAILRYWKAGDLWLDGSGVVQDQAEIDALLAQDDTYVDIIEDLSNVNLNYSFDIGDIDGFTVRFVPMFSPIVTAAATDYQFAVAGSLDSTEIPFRFFDPATAVGEVPTAEESAEYQQYQTIIGAIEGLETVGAQQQALERAGTSYLRNFGTQGMLIGRDKMEGIMQHLDAVRDPALGVTQVTGTQANIRGQADYSMMAATDSATDVAMALDENGDATFAASERSTVFISGSASTGDLDRTENGAGADYNGYSLTVGADYSFTDLLRTGAAVAYGESDAEIEDGRGSLDVDGTSLMVFGSYGGATGLYGDAVLGYSWLDYDNERKIVIGDTVNERAESSTDGEQMSLALRSGYNFVLGSVVAGPSARYQYLDLEVDGYEESGAGVLSMSVDDMDFESSTLWLGGEVSMPIVRDDSFLRPTAHVHWVKEFEDDGTSVDTSFTGGAVPFVTPIDGRDSDYIRAGIGFDGSFETGGMPTTVSLNYDGTFDNDDYEDHRATLGVDVRF
ncbi:choice-of-anchor F family protein [Halomonas smyrnensis]|uniref:choice-of-anchor F family protein n=1 Tax=Halomonas smyrnensis TaxID=720605 RepID=UPI00178C5F1F|nr:choice-of-anchor F family protein [Halomonas smyrnensis]